MIKVSLRIFPEHTEIDVVPVGATVPEDDADTGVDAAFDAPPAGETGVGPLVPAPRMCDASVVDGRPDNVTFAGWLAGALRREGMTMEAAARQLGVSVKTVSRWVGGTTEPRLRDLSRIREIFGELPFP
jgi:hypothetical protein